jgi:two-component system, cell cycle sensor histidine kinase and response regulator CckA
VTSPSRRRHTTAAADFREAAPVSLAVLPEALAILDHDLVFSRVNPAAATALGRRIEEIEGVAASAVLSAALHAELSSYCEEAYVERRPIQLVHPLRLDGRPWIFRIHAINAGFCMLFWERLEGEDFAFADDSGGKDSKLRASYRESETRFRTLIDALDLGIFIARDLRISYANPHCRAIFGYEGNEVPTDLPVTDLVLAEDRADLLDLIRSCTSDGVTSDRRVLRGVRRDGSLVELDVHGNGSIIDGSLAFIGVVVDVTERERAAAALREREEQLRHAQKLEAVGRLAGGIAHDFNNLLMVIQGSVNLILMDPSADNPHRQDLQEIVRATERAAALTRQLLAFGRKQVLRPKVVNINATIEDLNKMIGRVIGADIELRTELDPALSSVRVDPGQLEQVALNLIVNARDAMPAGGVLTLRTEDWELTRENAARAPYRVIPGPYVRLTVRDTGVGMPESVLKQVFEPFFTTKPRGKGSGLGLSTAYGIVKQSGGYIWITSQPGRGTTIEIYLPRVDEPAEISWDVQPDALMRGSGCVLLVEDEEPVRVITRRLLEKGGYTVIEAAGGTEAVQRYDDSPGQIDVVLTDVVMPQMGGHELATHLRARDPGIRLLYMSGYADNRSVRRGSEGRGDDFIQKPFTPETLLARIGALLRD